MRAQFPAASHRRMARGCTRPTRASGMRRVTTSWLQNGQMTSTETQTPKCSALSRHSASRS